MELSYELAVKKRYSIMSIDDNTNPGGVCCGNLAGMCCSRQIMDQKDILSKTQDAYLVTNQQNCEGPVSEGGFSSYRAATTEQSHTTPLLSNIKKQPTEGDGKKTDYWGEK